MLTIASPYRWVVRRLGESSQQDLRCYVTSQQRRIKFQLSREPGQRIGRAKLVLDSKIRPSGPSLVLLVKLRVSARQRYVAPVDEHLFNLRSYLKRIAVGNNQICDLAWLD